MSEITKMNEITKTDLLDGLEEDPGLTAQPETAPQVIPLSLKELAVVDYCEEYWHTYSKFPPVGTLEAEFAQLSIKQLLLHPTFRLSMKNRGIILPETKSPNRLSKEQLAAAIKFLDLHDKRALGTKLKEVGVTTTQWYAWMKDPVFKDFVLESSSKDFEDALHEAQHGLRQAIDRGETNAIKFYYEVTNRYNSQTGQVGNIKVVLAQVLEAIQRHVKDPEVIRAIGQDFENILQAGGTSPVDLVEPPKDYLRLI